MLWQVSAAVYWAAAHSCIGRYYDDSRGLFKRNLDDFLCILIILSGILISSYYSIFLFEMLLENYVDVMYKITKDVKYW